MKSMKIILDSKKKKKKKNQQEVNEDRIVGETKQKQTNENSTD